MAEQKQTTNKTNKTVYLTTDELSTIARGVVKELSEVNRVNQPSFEITLSVLTDVLDEIDADKLSRREANMVIGMVYKEPSMQNSRSYAVLDNTRTAFNKTYAEAMAKAKAARKKAHQKEQQFWAMRKQLKTINKIEA